MFMSARANSAASAGAANQAVLGLALYVRVLDILSDIGVAIANALVQHTEGETYFHSVAAFERVACTVRRIIMLVMEIGAPDYGAPAKPGAPAAERVSREIKARMPRRPWDDAARERQEARRDLLDEPDVPYDLKNKTMDELIREICRDLGLPELDGAHCWLQLAPEEIAKLVIEAAALLLGEAAAERAAPTIPDGVFWGTRSWLSAKARQRSRPRVHDG